jgi:hypothetical protein
MFGFVTQNINNILYIITKYCDIIFGYVTKSLSLHQIIVNY